MRWHLLHTLIYLGLAWWHRTMLLVFVGNVAKGLVIANLQCSTASTCLQNCLPKTSGKHILHYCIKQDKYMIDPSIQISVHVISPNKFLPLWTFTINKLIRKRYSSNVTWGLITNHYSQKTYNPFFVRGEQLNIHFIVHPFFCLEDLQLNCCTWSTRLQQYNFLA
jgi:hypothetical protein